MDVTSLELTMFQTDLVSGFFSLTFAVFLGSALFFFLSRREVAPRYRMAVRQHVYGLGVLGPLDGVLRPDPMDPVRRTLTPDRR